MQIEVWYIKKEGGNRKEWNPKPDGDTCTGGFPTVLTTVTPICLALSSL